MVSVPLRCANSGRDDDVYCTGPVSPAAESVIQDVLLRALQSHCGSLLVIVIVAVLRQQEKID